MKKIISIVLVFFIFTTFIAAPVHANTQKTLNVMTADGLKTITIAEDKPISVITKNGIQKRYLNQLYFIDIDGNIFPVVIINDYIIYKSYLCLSRLNAKN